MFIIMPEESSEDMTKDNYDTFFNIPLKNFTDSFHII